MKQKLLGGNGSPSLIVVAGAGNVEALDKSHKEIWKRISEKTLTISSKWINPKKGKAKNIPRTLTDAMLLILVNWDNVARRLSKKEIIPKEELFREKVCVFKVIWMIKALEKEFPDLILMKYEDKGNKGQVDFGRLRSSVTAIISQSLEAFKTAGFMKYIANDTKRKFSRIYTISPDFSFEKLKRIYINRFEAEQN